MPGPPGAPRSPANRTLGPLEVPPPERLHGKQWQMGDPHSRYKFMRVLGTGHYGVTYLCSSLKSGELVAIKALDKLHPEYERDLACEEILILAAVSDHPNVVDMHEVWEDASYLYIVMEACMGGELFDMVIERKHFTEADAASITAAVLSVMQHCHSKGIIHRDLKPENFLLLREGELSADNLRAIDFGLSKFVELDGICRSCVGSSYYVAPEVLKGAYSYEADAWSVGTITYILLSGFPPFWGSSDQVIFHCILTKPVDFDYQPWHQISAAAKHFVGRLLDKDPARRMAVSQGLTHPWITEKAADVPLSMDIISRLQNFTHQNRVKCLLMAIAANHLSDEEIGGLRKIFHFIDADADGEISMHDLGVALQHAGLDMEQQGMVALLRGLDLAHQGTVSVEEFIAAALDQRKVLTAKTVNSIFSELDDDKDGLITLGELQQALEECNISIKADTLGRLMHREGALDNKGMVSSKSFADLLMNGQDSQPLELDEWMQDVRQFSAANGFKQLAMLVVAQHMQPSEVESLRHLFQALDEDATGTISMQQLQEAMRHMGKEVGEAELRQLLEALDVRHHGVIEYDEFLAACLEEQHLTDSHVRAAFDFFDHNQSGQITESDVVQVLRDVGMDESDAEQLMAAASVSRAPSAAAGSEAAAAARGGGTAPGSGATSRCISYEDFRRMLLNQPAAVITQALSRAGSRGPSRPSSAPGGPARRLRLVPSANDYEPEYSDVDESPHPAGGVDRAYPGFQPPSPISLVPRYEPPSPISLRPRQEPPSPGGSGRGNSPGGRDTASPGSRPYGGYGSSPLAINLSRRTPLSPMASLGSPGGGNNSGSSGGGGMTLQQILQQYSSSGYTPRAGGSRRASLDAPRRSTDGAARGVSRGSSVQRESVLSQASDIYDNFGVGND
ncbi:calcium-dependent kinase 1 [Micractinium conductrix]|uniref:Calcium-dependent kinase 1 n=1 Tax=Micractinium conductrix TaxID=554055 RepID=A0A2P6VEG1_9CHLO|nr:calcium-dependent kinase 1 [Micractinium conductrix]|eukprot:PSC72461.1 calcium-dependent kinase 1 [Micractinium conductrix]